MELFLKIHEKFKVLPQVCKFFNDIYGTQWRNEMAKTYKEHTLKYELNDAEAAVVTFARLSGKSRMLHLGLGGYFDGYLNRVADPFGCPCVDMHGTLNMKGTFWQIVGVPSRQFVTLDGEVLEKVQLLHHLEDIATDRKIRGFMEKYFVPFYHRIHEQHPQIDFGMFFIELVGATLQEKRQLYQALFYFRFGLTGS